MILALCLALTQDVVSINDLEAEAKKLIDEAKQLQADGKYVDAAQKYKQVLREYRILIFTKSIDDKEIKGYIKECGLAIVGDNLKELKLYEKPHRDAINGFEFYPPDGWRGIPPQKAVTDEKNDWSQYFKTPMKRIGLYTFPYLDDLYLVIWKLEDVATLGDIETQFEKYLRDRVKDLSSSEKGTIKLAYPAATREFSSKETGDRMYTIYIHDKDSRYGLVALLNWSGLDTEVGGGDTATKVLDVDSSWKTVKDLIDASARKMMIVQKRGLDSYKKKWNNGALCPGWSVHRTKNFHIEYATDEAFAIRLGEELELIQKVYRIAVPTKNTIPMCVVKAFASEEDFIAYSGAYGAAAYWSPMQEEIVCYKFPGGEVQIGEAGANEKRVVQKQAADNVTFKIIYHEGFHQYTHYVMGHDRMVYIPSWINEGVGDYFFGGEVVTESGKTRFKIGLNDWRLETIYNAVKENKHVPLRQIFDYEQRDYYSNAGLCYAEGWAICHFLLNSKNKAYARFPSMLIDALRKEDDFRKATAAVKKALGLDYDKMEEEWKAYVLENMVPPEKPKPEGE